VLLPRGETKLRAGIDLHRNEFDAEQVAIATGLRRDTFNDNRRSRIGSICRLGTKAFRDQWSSRIGLRGDVVMSDADPVSNRSCRHRPRRR
jgi:hypothetical protein